MDYFVQKSSLLKNNNGNIQTTTEEIKEVSIFPKNISPKVNWRSHSLTMMLPGAVEFTDCFSAEE